MQLYLFRHADKKSALHDDPELSAMGLLKAQNLSKQILAGELPKPSQLWCSPKIRTQQTFQFMGADLRINLDTSPLLLEKSSLETSLEFENRIEKFLSGLRVDFDPIYICSHYDWVIKASEYLLKDKFFNIGICHHWYPCQFVAFEQKNDEWSVTQSGVVTA